MRTSSTGFNNSSLYKNNGAGVFSIVTGDGDLDLLGANGGRRHVAAQGATGPGADRSARTVHTDITPFSGG